MRSDVMIDLETMGNGPDAAIVQIGGIYFNRETGDFGEQFSARISLADAVSYGGRIDAMTVEWWMQQSEAARNSLLATPRESMLHAMHRLNEFLESAEAIWSHATFDFVIVMETLKRLGMKPKFSFRAARDLRTLVDLSGVNLRSYERVGTHHDALDDCAFQIKYTVDALKRLKVSP